MWFSKALRDLFCAKEDVPKVSKTRVDIAGLISVIRSEKPEALILSRGHVTNDYVPYTAKCRVGKIEYLCHFSVCYWTREDLPEEMQILLKHAIWEEVGGLHSFKSVLSSPASLFA